MIPLPATASAWMRAGWVALAAFVLMGIAYSALVPAQARFPDEHEYFDLSTHILHGPGYSLDGIHLTTVRPPGYAYFLAAARLLGGGIIGVRLVQFLLVAGTILLVARLAAESPRPPRLLIVAALTAAYPVSFYLAGTLYPQTLGGFLFLLVLTLLLAPSRSLFLNAATGLVFGSLILVVPTFAFTFVIAVVGAWALKYLRLRDLPPMAVGLALVMGAWTTRNYLVFHQVVPIATNSGFNLLLGNCENTDPTAGSGTFSIGRFADEADALHLDEFALDRYYRDSALGWIRSHPGPAFVLYLKKTANFFNVVNQYDPRNAGEVSPWKQAINAASYLLLVALLAWRLGEMKRTPLTRLEILLLAIYVLSAFTSAIFITRIRFRVPYDYLLITIVAMHLARKCEAWGLCPKSSS